MSHQPPATSSTEGRRIRRPKATLWARLTGTRGGRAALALATAIAVPAMAAPGDWRAFDKPDTGFTIPEAPKPLAFEQAGNSFPGSAFYFIEAEPRLAYDFEAAPPVLFDQTGTGGQNEEQLVSISDVGPAARAFLSAGTGTDKARALQCLATAVYYEAASESIGGQRAVAQVVLNRVKHPSYPNSVCGVVYQGSERRTGCQFSFTCDGSLRRTASATGMARARMVANDALSGEVYKPVGLATHYHTVWINPYWAPSLDHLVTIGAHRFYTWKGAAGRPNAFSASYRGAEPVAAPNVRRNADYATDVADPLELQKVFEAERRKAEVQSRAATPRQPAPVYSQQIQDRGGDAIFTADNLPSGGGVKEEYANSGRWIAEPGSAN